MSRRLFSKYRESSSRTSSASRDSESGVNPTRSANSTVTSRRSAAGASRTVAAAAPSRRLPHSPQKLTSGSLAAPQAGQLRASGVPQLPQNFRPAAFSAPQFAQSGIAARA